MSQNCFFQEAMLYPFISFFVSYGLWSKQYNRVLNIFSSITLITIKYIRRTFKELIFAKGNY